MSKPKPVRVLSDGCAITIGDDTYRPHEGEWVEMLAIQSVAELQEEERIRRLGVEIDAVRGEPDEASRLSALMDAHFERLCEVLAVRIVDWNWTDDLGRPLPRPDGSPAPLKRLRTQELYWLLTATRGEMPEQRKNDLAPSPTTSSDTESQATGAKSRTSGRSHTKA